MSVTIDEMQIDVKESGTQAPAQAPAAASPKEPVDLRQQVATLAERQARLKTD